MPFNDELDAGEWSIRRKQYYGSAKLHHSIEYGSRRRG
jgi:hypothetical protein